MLHDRVLRVLSNPFLAGTVVLMLSIVAAHVAYGVGINYVGALAGAVVSTAIGLATGRLMRRKQERMDAYQTHTFYQNMRISSATQKLTSILEQCQHNSDSGHEQCRAAVRTEIRNITAAMGSSPMPEVLRGNLAGKEKSTPAQEEGQGAD